MGMKLTDFMSIFKKKNIHLRIKIRGKSKYLLEKKKVNPTKLLEAYRS